MLKIIVAGILALPALLVLIVTAPLVAILALPSLWLLLFRKPSTATQRKVLPDHVVITGGSSGIGLCIAKECIQRGVSKVTILARNPKKLEEAKQQLLAVTSKSNLTNNNNNNNTTKIQAISVNVSDAKAISNVAKELCSTTTTTTSNERLALFHCAGFAYPTYYERIEPSKYLEMAQTNQLGVMITTRAFLEYMTEGVIVMTSSAAGQVGIFGLTAYAPTKFALRGYAESLHQELVAKPIHVQVAFPADTDTPGYAEELKMSPPETKALSDSVGLTSADV